MSKSHNKYSSLNTLKTFSDFSTEKSFIDESRLSFQQIIWFSNLEDLIQIF